MHPPSKWSGIEPRLRAYLVRQGWSPGEAQAIWDDLLCYTHDAPEEADACFTVLAHACGIVVAP